MCFTIFLNEKRLSRLSKQEKSQETEIFSKRSVPAGFGTKVASLHLSILGKKGPQNVFNNTLLRKNAFIGYRNKRFIKSKIEIIPKGFVHGYGPKLANFPSVILHNLSQPLFLGEKKTFQSYKCKKVKN